MAGPVSARRARRAVLVAALALAYAARWSSGQTTGSIEGRLSDTAGGALPGAKVSGTSQRLQGARTAISDASGFFRLPALPPGDYVIRAALPGFRDGEKSVRVRLDGTASVDLVLEPVRTEDVVVSGATPRIDPTSTTTGTSYTSTQISHLPMSRNYADLVRANPGVSIDRGYADDRTLAIAIYGATSVENQWNVDGVNTTGVFLGTQAKKVAPEFIQEIEVKTGGYGAKYGGALGGVINVVTKAGGNEFHGDAFTNRDVWRSDVFVPGEPVVVEDEWRSQGWSLDVGADLGGYLWKDRLWFFGAFNLIEVHDELSRFEPTTLISTDDRFPSDYREVIYSGKLTWNAGSSTNVVGTVFADPVVHAGITGDPPVNPDPTTWYSARNGGGTDFGVRLTQLFGARAIATIEGGYHKEGSHLAAFEAIRYEDVRCSGGTLDVPCAEPDEPNSITGGFGWIGGLAERPVSSRSQYRGAVTLYEGNHEIEAGGGYSFGRTDGFGNYTGGQTVKIRSDTGQTYYEHNYIAVAWDDPTPVAGVNRGAGVEDLAVFLQDSWKAAPGLTINAGLRWDGENIDDYAGETVLRLSAWQPRVGVVWDPWNDGATKIFASAGRFFGALPTVGAAGAFADATVMQVWNLDPVSLDPDPRVLGHEDGEPRLDWGGGAFGVSVDTDISPPYQDELTVGVERSLGHGLTVGATGMYRRLGSAIETRCDFREGCALITPGSSGQFARGDAPTCNGLAGDWYECGPPGPAAPRVKRVYRGIELLARQTIGTQLWLQASYVYSSLRGNYDGGVNEERFETWPGFNTDFDFPAVWQSGYGILSLDRPHRFRFDGYWDTPWRLSVGLQAFVESGAPYNKLGYFNDDYGAVVYLVPRGSAGRLPALWDANLSVAYPITLGPVTATLQMYFLNVFNNQVPISIDEGWSNRPSAGYPKIYDPNQPQSNESYGAVTGRWDPRSIRAALRVSF